MFMISTVCKNSYRCFSKDYEFYLNMNPTIEHEKGIVNKIR